MPSFKRTSEGAAFVSIIPPSNRVVLCQIVDESSRKLPFAVTEPIAGRVAVNEVTLHARIRARDAGGKKMRIFTPRKISARRTSVVSDFLLIYFFPFVH